MWKKDWIPKLSVGDVYHQGGYDRDSGYRKIVEVIGQYSADRPWPHYKYVKCRKDGSEYKTAGLITCEWVDKRLGSLCTIQKVLGL